MTWILVLNLLSNPTGNYVQTFSSEKECLAEMNKFIRLNDSNEDDKYIGCVFTYITMNEEN